MKTTNLLDLINKYLKDTFNAAAELKYVPFTMIVDHIHRGNLVQATKLLRKETEVHCRIPREYAFHSSDTNLFNNWLDLQTNEDFSNVSKLDLKITLDIIKFIDHFKHEL